MPIDCVIDENGCLVCPEIKAAAAVRPTTSISAALGWNAGANSIKELSGDIQLTIPMQLGMVGVVVGLRSVRSALFAPTVIEYGYYFFMEGGDDYYQVIERGVTKTLAIRRLVDDSFVVRRIGVKVVYLVNGIIVFESSRPSIGSVLVGACLYSAGDKVGTPSDSSAGLDLQPLPARQITPFTGSGGTKEGITLYFPEHYDITSMLDLAQVSELFSIDVPEGASSLNMKLFNAVMPDAYSNVTSIGFYCQKDQLPSYVDAQLLFSTRYFGNAYSTTATIVAGAETAVSASVPSPGAGTYYLALQYSYYDYGQGKEDQSCSVDLTLNYT